MVHRLIQLIQVIQKTPEQMQNNSCYCGTYPFVIFRVQNQISQKNKKQYIIFNNSIIIILILSKIKF